MLKQSTVACLFESLIIRNLKTQLNRRVLNDTSIIIIFVDSRSYCFILKNIQQAHKVNDTNNGHNRPKRAINSQHPTVFVKRILFRRRMWIRDVNVHG